MTLSSVHVALDPALDGERRLSIWRDAMSLAGDIVVPDPDRLAGAFRSRNLGTMRTVDVDASTFRITRDRAGVATIPREHVIVNLVERGSWTGRLAGRPLKVQAGDVVLSQTRNQLDLLMEDARWLGLLIPRALFERHMPWHGRFDGWVYPAGSVNAAILGGLVRALCSLSDTLPPREVRRAAAASLATLLACLDAPRSSAAVDDGEREALAVSIRHFIIDRLGDPSLNIALLCRTFDLSRSALYRAMGENGDIASIIRTLRLQAAARDIADPAHRDISIAELATRWGFADERTFRRAFIREHGASPSAVRDGTIAPPILGPVGTSFYQWFLGA